MKNTLKPLPSFSGEDTMRTNESEYKRLEDTIEQIKAENAELRKDKERLDWLIDNNCEIYEPDTALLYCDCDRESIDEMMNDESKTNSEEQCAFCEKPDVFKKGLCPICFEDHYGN